MNISAYSNVSFQANLPKKIMDTGKIAIKNDDFNRLSRYAQNEFLQGALCPKKDEDIITCSGFRHSRSTHFVMSFTEQQKRLQQKVKQLCKNINLPFKD